MPFVRARLVAEPAGRGVGRHLRHSESALGPPSIQCAIRSCPRGSPSRPSHSTVHQVSTASSSRLRTLSRWSMASWKRDPAGRSARHRHQLIRGISFGCGRQLLGWLQDLVCREAWRRPPRWRSVRLAGPGGSGRSQQEGGPWAPHGRGSAALCAVCRRHQVLDSPRPVRPGFGCRGDRPVRGGARRAGRDRCADRPLGTSASAPRGPESVACGELDSPGVLGLAALAGQARMGAARRSWGTSPVE